MDAVDGSMEAGDDEEHEGSLWAEVAEKTVYSGRVYSGFEPFS